MYRYATTRHSVAAHFRRPRQRRTASVALYVCVGVVVAAVGTADELPAAPAAQIRTIVEQVAMIRTDGTAYAVSGHLPDGPWYLRLFKRNFQVVVKEGSISEVKLRCDKGYVTFPLDPTMQYHVANTYADCEMELDGAPGTRFGVVQS